MATDALPTYAAIEAAYNRGYNRGYEMGARGHFPGNMLVMVLPDADPDLLAQVRERVHQVLVEEGLATSSVMTVEG